MEKLFGYLNDAVNGDLNYKQIKAKWGFPDSQNFNIEIKGTQNFKFDRIKPADNSDVYVRQISDYILNDNGELEPVTIRIVTW